jgi:ABC-type Fe3+ transport system substrate-binding protein
MMKRTIAVAVLALALSTSSSIAAELPKSTQKALADLKFDAPLEGLDAELAVPDAWIEGAKQNKDLIVSGTWEAREFQAMTAPFRERYPFINLRYDRSGTSERGMQVLVALGQGRVLVDVITGFTDAAFQFKEANVLADLRDLPGFSNIRRDYVAADGIWLSHKLSYRCMAYNTDTVKKSELPQTWDDLVKDPAWSNGNLALTNNPSAWLLALWGQFGETWGTKFTTDLFERLKPQRRKEGLTALTGLVVAGEFKASLPSPEWVAMRYVSKGAPLGYHCPSPVPITLSTIAVVEKSPRKDAARLFVNWIISREGQLLQYATSFAVPVHEKLQLPQFVPFSDTIIGKQLSVRDDALLTSDTNKKMVELWEGYWTGSPGRSKTP